MKITQYRTILNDGKCEIMNNKSMDYGGDIVFDNPDKIHAMLCDVFQHDKQAEEYIYLLCLNTNNKLLGVFELSHGTVNASLCGTREIFQKALLCNASRIVLAHNHPSGNVTPSGTDLETYEKVKQAGEIMDVPLMDNLIIGDGYYSFFANEQEAR